MVTLFCFIPDDTEILFRISPKAPKIRPKQRGVSLGAFSTCLKAFRIPIFGIYVECRYKVDNDFAPRLRSIRGNEAESTAKLG